MSQIVTKNIFVNNQIIPIYMYFLNKIVADVFPRTKQKMLQTYDKAVQTFKDLNKSGPLNLPAITLDPTYDFEPNENTDGYLFVSYSKYYANLGKERCKGEISLYRPGNFDQITLSPVFTRYRGAFELLFWGHSIYENIDFRIATFQYFGGLNRYTPDNEWWIPQLIVIPDDIKNIMVNNIGNVPIETTSKLIDVQNVDSMGNSYLCVDIPLNPRFRVSQITDGSSKYGGDDMAPYKTSVQVYWECNIPTYMVLDVDQVLVTISQNYSQSQSLIMNSMTQNRIDETDVIAPNQRLKYLFSDQEVEDTAQEVKIKLDPIYKFNINEPHFYDTSYINDTTMISNSPIDERSIRVASYNGEIYRKTDTYNGWEIEYNNDDTSYYLNVPIEAVSGEGVDVFVYNTQYYNNTTIEMTTAE